MSWSFKILHKCKLIIYTKAKIKIFKTCSSNFDDFSTGIALIKLFLILVLTNA